MFSLIRKWVSDAVVAGIRDGIERATGRKLESCQADADANAKAALSVERLLEAPKGK